MVHQDHLRGLEGYGQSGVDALSSATPRRTGKTAESWKYRVIRDRSHPRIEWYNTNIRNGSVIAVLIQYGHGTGTGGYVQGRDYINPAIRPIFDKIADDMWRQVKAS
jgi:hypothetical protein